MRIEIVYALPEKQALTSLEVEPGTTVGEAIEQSGVLSTLQHLQRDSRLRGNDGENNGRDLMAFSDLQVGIFSQKCSLDHRLEPGDRIEIYRPLLVDPKERRRQRLS